MLVFGILIAGAAIAVLAPGLTGALMEGLSPLGVDFQTDDEGSAGAGWYVLFAFLAVGFFAFLVAPMLFPKARDKREKVISDVTGNFRVLDVFVDQDKRAERGVAELRRMNEEVKRMHGTPTSGLPAAPSEQESPSVAIDAAGVGASEEPTVSRPRPTTGKEQAISELPQLQPLGAGPSEEPTRSVQRPAPPAAATGGRSTGRSDEPDGPVIRRLDGVRSADYRSPEPVVTDEDATIERADRPRMPLIDDPDESTNIIPGKDAKAASVLARAADVEAGPEDATALHAELQEDLRRTIQDSAYDPAGPDAPTTVRGSKDE